MSEMNRREFAEALALAALAPMLGTGVSDIRWPSALATGAGAAAGAAHDPGALAQALGGVIRAQYGDRLSEADLAMVTRQIEVDAALSDGQPLTYSFSGGGGGSLVSEGASATWTVEGAGTFTANIAVSAQGYPCSSFASVTFTVEPQAADEGSGEGEGEGEGE